MKIFVVLEKNTYGETYINAIHITERGALQTGIMNMYDHISAYGYTNELFRDHFENLCDRIEYGNEVSMKEILEGFKLLTEACENVGYFIVIQADTLKP